MHFHAHNHLHPCGGDSQVPPSMPASDVVYMPRRWPHNPQPHAGEAPPSNAPHTATHCRHVTVDGSHATRAAPCHQACHTSCIHHQHKHIRHSSGTCFGTASHRKSQPSPCSRKRPADGSTALSPHDFHTCTCTCARAHAAFPQTHARTPTHVCRKHVPRSMRLLVTVCTWCAHTRYTRVCR